MFPVEDNALELAGVLKEAGIILAVKEGTIYWLEGSVVRHALWKPWKRSKKERYPSGFAPGNSDQLLDYARIMADRRKDALAM